MTFEYTSENKILKEKARDFAKAHLNHENVKRDSTNTFSRAHWEKCASFGIQGYASTSNYHGHFDKVQYLSGLAIMEGLGYGCKDNGLCFALNAQMWTVQIPILEFGTEDQKKQFLEPMVQGKAIGCHALSEPEAGSDVFAMKLEAKKHTLPSGEEGYLLNGEKHYITLAPVADVILVIAVTNPKLGNWGLSAFLLESKMKGIKIGENQPKMGMKTVPFSNIKFENCFVEKSKLLGKEGSGFSILNHSLKFDRSFILGSQLGTMERQFEEALNYAKKREQFGQKIGKFQSVANRLVDMKLRLETSKLLLYKVISLIQKGENPILETAMLKLHLSESFIESSIDAIRTFGGQGYLTNNEIERNLRDAIGGVIYAGTSDIQKNIIAKLLGL